MPTQYIGATNIPGKGADWLYEPSVPEKPLSPEESAPVNQDMLTPPGKRPGDEDLRMVYARKVLKGIIEENGFNPIGYDPINEARKQTLEKANKYEGGGAYSRRQFSEDLRETTRLLIAKKNAAMETMKMAFDLYDKGMKWEKLDAGDMLVQPETGEKFLNPKAPEYKTPNEIELTARKLKGDKEAQAILDDMQKRKENAAREGRLTTLQSQFIDPESGLPLIFDRATNTYKIAQVEGGAIAPRPVNPSATEREKTASFSVLKDQLKRIKETYKSDYVGLISGQAGRIKQFIDPDEAAFRQVILDVKDSLLRARSGAQINEQEYKRLAKLVPDFTDSEPQFAGKMQSFEKTINTILEERKEAQAKGGVKLRGGSTVGRGENVPNKPKFIIRRVDNGTR